MNDLRAIYQEVILDHYRKPRNFHPLDGANQQANGHNPLCGDQVSVFLEIDDGLVKDVSFQGAGCAISTASASLMTEEVKGRTIEEARALFDRFHKMMTSDDDGERADLGKLEALSGVKQIPIRVKCATLAWHTLKAALDDGARASGGDPVSTEQSPVPGEDHDA